jgi:hypothetical protein
MNLRDLAHDKETKITYDYPTRAIPIHQDLIRAFHFEVNCYVEKGKIDFDTIRPDNECDARCLQR